MIVAGSTNPLLLSASSGYNLTRSLRFRSSASAYLNRTPASAGSRTTWTWSAWVKRGALDGNRQVLFACYNGTNNDTGVTELEFDGSNYLVLNGYSATWRVTSQVFRDPSAWYHLVLAVDTTQATGANRIKLYVNGTQITSFSSSSDPSQNYTLAINSAARHTLSNIYDSTPRLYFDGYLTEVNFIDGQALTPSSFGETSAKTGVWQPKAFSGTYGTNGFYLPFTNNASTTTIGYDFSGNGNNFTATNISLTSGSTYDSMTDVPTLTSATAANYCVLNPLNVDTTTLSNANLTASITGSSGGSSYFSTMAIPPSSKIYAEITVTSVGDSTELGITSDSSSPLNAKNNGIFYYFNGDKEVLGSLSAYGASYTANDVIGVAIDTSAGTIQFFKNNTSQGTITNSVISQNTMFLACVYYSSSTSFTGVHNWNFGQRPFAYTPPTGYVALNTYNLPTPTIGATASSQANKYMDINLYTGTGAAQTITNSGGFQPDFVWTKSRSNAYSHLLADSVRGNTKYLYSNLTNAEGTDSNNITSFNSNGYSLGTGDANFNGSTFVGWQWKANGTGVTNTAGSITSTVSANTTSGFSVVTYTGTGSNATVGHGLGVAPKMVIVKNRNNARLWPVYHASIGAGNRLVLNDTAASSADSGTWNSTAPNSTVFYIGTSSATNNSGSDTYVAYCFAEIAGFSKFGSYTGNGSSDGVFVYTGFKPKYVLWKRTDAINSWIVKDGSRNPYNAATYRLYPDQSYAEDSGDDCDFVSNGFKIRSSGGSTNASGGTYIYMAFAENPFKYSLAR